MVPPHPLHHPRPAAGDGRLDVRAASPRQAHQDDAWPPGHPLAGYDPAQLVQCPACGLPVGVRQGRLNRHRVRSPRGDDPLHVEPDGVRASPLGPDGWCRATA